MTRTITIRRLLFFLVGFTAGLFAGAVIVGWFACRTLLRSQIDGNTAVAATASDALASLRTGDTATAERHLEAELDSGVQWACQGSIAAPWYCGLTPQQTDQLAHVKYYRRAFPSTQPGHIDVVSLLADVRDLKIQPEPGCNSGYCRIARRGESRMSDGPGDR